MTTHFWILYHDRKTQLIPADRYGSAGDNWFFNRGGVDNAIIAKDVVESIRPMDVPEPVGVPEPPAKHGAVAEAGGMQFRVTYRDGGTEVIEADRWDPAGDNYVFNRGGAETVIARASVESFMFANIPEPEGPPEPPAEPKPPFGFVSSSSS